MKIKNLHCLSKFVINRVKIRAHSLPAFIIQTSHNDRLTATLPVSYLSPSRIKVYSATAFGSY
jgi:hypothetical protein